MTVRILEGDCRDVLRTLPEESVHAIVTDPPYELTATRPGGRSEATRGKVMGGFMGMKWDGTGVAFDPATWSECLRVLKPGGHLLAFGGARTYHRLACAVEGAGFEIRDQIMWLYGSGFPKSKNLKGEWEGWGTALKPAHEPIVVARKPLVGTVSANVRAHGCGVLNIDATRIPTDESLGGGAEKKTTASQKGVDGWVRPWMDDPAMRDAHAARVRANVEHAEALGRWPANVIHDGSEEVVERFPRDAGAVAPVRGSEPSTIATNIYGKRDIPGLFHDATGSAARFYYCAKSSRADREAGCEGLPTRRGGMVSNTSGQHITRRDGGAPGARANYHPTVKPTELMRYLVRLVTPPGGVVLDPFAGSGSTGRAASIEGFDAILIEVDPDYVAIARRRISGDAPLFAELVPA